MTPRYEGRLPVDYETAERLLRGKESQRWTGVNHTEIRRVYVPTERVEVLHHGSVIATFFANGAMRFSSAGYSSWSTNQRLNTMVPEGVAYRILDGSTEFRIVRGGRMETISAYHYDLMVHIDGRLEAVTRER